MSRSRSAGLVAYPVRRGGPAVGVSHLLVARDALSSAYWGASQIAVCGIEVHPGSDTTVKAEEDPGYCPACVTMPEDVPGWFVGAGTSPMPWSVPGPAGGRSAR